jgi:hypothetical protein
LEDKHLEQARQAVALGRAVLTSHPTPDTFAGRKTQEPFPKEDEG